MCIGWLKRKLQRKETLSGIEARILADYAKQADRPGMRVKALHHGGPNMPNHQPCPVCGRESVRESKREEGAYYRCGTHGIFFVRRAQRKPKVPVTQHSK